MNIRHAEPEDAEQIHNVALRSWRDTYRQILSSETIENMVNKWYSADDLREQADHPVFYVAKVEDDIVGFVHASVEEDVANLRRIYIDPDNQRSGVGSKLYQKAENNVKSEAEKFRVEVLVKNEKAISFYKKQGFKEENNERVQVNGEEAEQKIMTKNFNE